MGHASSWKNPSTHITYKRGDKIVVTGTIQNSADGQSGTWGSVTKQTYYFYSYFTADWTVRAPICIGQSPGSAWAFIKADAIVSGGTKESYTIKYDANGGSGAPGNQTKYYATNITLSKTLPTRAGHTFSKWNTKKDGTGTSYAAGATFKANAATTLYAQWTPYTHTISYDANGGTGAPANQIKKYGSMLTLRIIKPTRDGYAFERWNTKKDGTGTSYMPGDTYTVDQNGGSITLYAIWKAITYNIVYDANGGTGAPAGQMKTHGTSLRLRSEIPVRSGFRFVKWNTRANGSGTSYDAGALYSVNVATTLYAQWEVDNVCAIKTASGWKFGIAYIKVNGKWVQGEHVYIKVNGKWILGTR